MEIVGFVVGGLGALGTIAGWVAVALRMFRDRALAGTGSRVAGVLVIVWAFVWGWRHRDAFVDQRRLMVGWTTSVALYGVGIVVLAQV